MRTALTFEKVGIPFHHTVARPLPDDRVPQRHLVRLGRYAGTVEYFGDATPAARFIMAPEVNRHRGLLRKLIDYLRHDIGRDGTRRLSAEEMRLSLHVDNAYETMVRAIGKHAAGKDDVGLVELRRLSEQRTAATRSWELACRCASTPAQALLYACTRMETDPKGAWNEVALVLQEPAVNALLWRDTAALRKIFRHCPDIAGLWSLASSPGSPGALLDRVLSDRYNMAALLRLASRTLIEHLNTPETPQHNAILAFLKAMPVAYRRTMLARAMRGACEVRQVGELFAMATEHGVAPESLLANGMSAKNVRTLLLHEMGQAASFGDAWRVLRTVLVAGRSERGGKVLPDIYTPPGFWQDVLPELFGKLQHYEEAEDMAGVLDYRLYVAGLGRALRDSEALRCRIVESIIEAAARFLDGPMFTDDSAYQSDLNVFAVRLFALVTGRRYEVQAYRDTRVLHRSQICLPAAALLWSDHALTSRLWNIALAFSGSRFATIAPLMKCHSDPHFVKVIETPNPAYVDPARFGMSPRPADQPSASAQMACAQANA